MKGEVECRGLTFNEAVSGISRRPSFDGLGHVAFAPTSLPHRRPASARSSQVTAARPGRVHRIHRKFLPTPRTANDTLLTFPAKFPHFFGHSRTRHTFAYPCLFDVEPNRNPPWLSPPRALLHGLRRPQSPPPCRPKRPRRCLRRPCVRRACKTSRVFRLRLRRRPSLPRLRSLCSIRACSRRTPRRSLQGCRARRP